MTRLLSALLLLMVASAVTGQQVKNEVFDELVNVGIQIPDGPKVKIPTPMLMPGQAVKIDDAFLEKAADKVPVELFLKRSLNAPHFFKIESIEKKNDQRCGQMLTLRFVAYGKLDSLLEGDVFKQLLGGKGQGAKAEAALLSPEDLAKRGIRLLNAPKILETYSTMSMSLLDKVQVEGVTRNLRTTTPNALLAATKLDDRFANDKEYPNRWRPFMGADMFGPAHPYSGLGGYVVVTVLPKPQDALLIEMHYLLHEPTKWFGGKNLLRSKLPIPVQDNVRSFRRKLDPK